MRIVVFLMMLAFSSCIIDSDITRLIEEKIEEDQEEEEGR